MIKKVSLFLFAGVLLMSACAPATVSAPATESSAATEAPTELPEATATAEPVHLKVGVLNYMSNGPLFIALDDGFFAEQGLDVEFVDFGFSDALMLPAMLSSDIDVAASTVGIGLLNAIAEGGNLKLVADKGFADPNACAYSGYLARKELIDDGTLSDISGLRGLKFGAFSRSTVEYTQDLLLEKAGLTYEDLEMVSITDASTILDGLTNGSIDVANHAEPWITRAKKGGVVDLWIPVSDVIPNMSIATVVYGPSLLGENKDVGVRFMKAYLQAIEQYTSEKSDRNVEIIAKYTKLDPAEIKESCWTSYQPDGKIDTTWLMKFQEWAVQKTYIDAVLPLEQIWDPTFVDQANADLNK